MLPLPEVGAVVGGGLFLLGLGWWLTSARGRSVVTWHAGRWRRPLGRCFELYYLKDQRYEDVHIVSFPHILVSRSVVEQRVIERALSRLANKHPLLKAKHLQEDGGRYFQEMDAFTLPLITSSKINWEKLVEEQLLKNFPRNTGPLWRVVYLPNVTCPDVTDTEFPHQFMLLFTFHHSIIDGTTAMYLMEDAVKYLEEAEQGTETHEERLPVPLAVDDLLPQLKVTWWRNITHRLRLWRVQNNQENSPLNMWLEKFGAEIWRNPQCEVKTCVISMVLGPEITSKLVSKCRKTNATVAGALQTVSCIVFTEMLQGGQITKDAFVSYSTTISMSKLLPRYFPVRSAAAYMTFMESDLPLTPGWKQRFWDIAQQCTRDIHKDIAEEGIMNLTRIRKVATTKWSPDALYEANTLGRYHCQVNMSNLGECSYINRDTNKVRIRASFCGNAEHRYGAIFFSNVVTIDGRLSWTLNYYPHITKRSVAEEFTSKVQSVIKMVIAE